MNRSSLLNGDQFYKYFQVQLLVQLPADTMIYVE